MLAAAWALAGIDVRAAPDPLRIETIQSEPFGIVDGNGSGGMMQEIGNPIAERAGLHAVNSIVP